MHSIERSRYPRLSRWQKLQQRVKNSGLHLAPFLSFVVSVRMDSLPRFSKGFFEATKLLKVGTKIGTAIGSLTKLRRNVYRQKVWSRNAGPNFGETKLMKKTLTASPFKESRFHNFIAFLFRFHAIAREGCPQCPRTQIGLLNFRSQISYPQRAWYLNPSCLSTRKF